MKLLKKALLLSTLATFTMLPVQLTVPDIIKTDVIENKRSFGITKLYYDSYDKTKSIDVTFDEKGSFVLGTGDKETLTFSYPIAKLKNNPIESLDLTTINFLRGIYQHKNLGLEEIVIFNDTSEEVIVHVLLAEDEARSVTVRPEKQTNLSVGFYESQDYTDDEDGIMGAFTVALTSDDNKIRDNFNAVASLFKTHGQNNITVDVIEQAQKIMAQNPEIPPLNKFTRRFFHNNGFTTADWRSITLSASTILAYNNGLSVTTE